MAQHMAPGLSEANTPGGLSPYAQGFSRAGSRFDRSGGSSSTPAGGDPYGSPRPRSHRRRSTILAVIGAIVAMLVVVAVALGVYAFGLYQSYQRIMAQVNEATSVVEPLKEALKSGDTDSLSAVSSTVTDAVHAIDDELGGTNWQVAERIPIVGQDVATVRTLVDVATDLVDNALAPVVASVSGLHLSELMVNGAVNVGLIRQVSSAVQNATPVIERLAQTVSALPEPRIGRLQGIFSQANDALALANGAVGGINEILPYLPQMLGADGQTRTYLVIAQNNAEIRATGGFPGSWGVVTITDGAISLGDFSTIAGERDVTFDITDEERALFGDGMAISPANLNMTPDFPRAGTLLASAWEAYMGQTINGVIAMDPVFIQSMLVLAGGVTAEDGTVIDGSNAAQVLLSDTYWRFGNDGDAQDEFFAYVAGLVADKFMESLGSIDAMGLLQTLSDAAKQSRLQVWMADAAEENVVMSLGFAGELPGDPAKPELGVYVNDDTWAKMGWYLGLDTQITGSTLNADGTSTYSLITTVSNSITEEEAEEAPTYVTGGSPARRYIGDMFVHLILVAPAGGSIENVMCSSDAQPRPATLYGHAVQALDLNAGPQETVTVTYSVTVAAQATEALAVHQTPTAR